MIEHMFDQVNMRHDDGVQLRPLTARSAILSMLLGAHPPSATVSEVVAFGRHVGINDSAVRAALTRMVGSGDLHREQGVYTLSDRLIDRQRRQDEAMEVPTGDWNGTWRVAAVVSTGKEPATRLHLRRSMLGAHFGELREGVWMRPDNLAWSPAPEIADDMELLRARPDRNAVALAHELFQPQRWAAAGRDLLRLAERAPAPRERLTAFAAIVRHLTHDPLLPQSLLPGDWPGGALRRAYDAFRDEVAREWRNG